MKAGVAFILLAVLFSSCSKQKVIGVNQRIHHDDFAYTVTGVSKAKTIGPPGYQRAAHGMFTIVTFRVENRALRVDHRWDNNIAYIVDSQGRMYENIRSAQELLYASANQVLQQEYATPAGKTDTAQFVFDLPNDALDPSLRMRGNFLMGDLFDGNAFKATGVRLY